jgi:hypothetical protein
VVNVFIWLLWWNKPLDVQRQLVVGPSKLPDAQLIGPGHVPWRDRFLSAIAGIIDSHTYNPPSILSFWSLPWDELDNIQGRLAPCTIEALVGTVFGAIHCAAWNTDFPTTAETWLWRSCSSIIVAIPAFIVLVWILITFTDVDESQWIWVLIIGFIVSISIYVIARLVLIILPLVAMWSLPPGALMDVNWSVYIPHL